MRRVREFCALGILVAVIFGMTGCGVPREAGRVAGVEVAALRELPADAEGVRAELGRQAAAWGELADLLKAKEVGGIWVDDGFVALVEEMAALARREEAIVEAGGGDEGEEREVLGKMKEVWGKVNLYLGQ